MNQQFFVTLISLLFAVQTDAQFNETIRTGRPGQAIGPFGVGKYVFQTQTGVDVGGFNEKRIGFSSVNAAPNTNMRFGVTRHLEINSAWEYRYDKYDKYGFGYSTNGLSLSTIGTRVNFFEGKKYIPAVGMQVSFKLPILSSAYDHKYVAPRILLIMSESLSKKFSLLMNFGVDYNGNDAAPTGLYILNLSYSISSKWGTFIETYGNFTRNTFENRWDGGFAYLLNDNLQLDIYGGAGYNYHRLHYFTSIGISWRVVTLRNKSLNKASE
jgi:hypothetical protein